MSFKQTTETIDSLITPDPKLVVNWIWMIDINSSDLVQAYGKKMIATHFKSKEAAELFTKKATDTTSSKKTISRANL